MELSIYGREHRTGGSELPLHVARLVYVAAERVYCLVKLGVANVELSWRDANDRPCSKWINISA
jgi:hypothetical protein